MKSWGDLNVALNRLVREGVIESFRTNRDAPAQDEVAVEIVAPADRAEDVKAIVRAALTGIFAEATINVLADG